MAKETDAVESEVVEEIEERTVPELDSKYRMIIVAAQRSKQIQKGARPRVDMDLQRHKPTRIALEEVQRGQVYFTITERE